MSSRDKKQLLVVAILVLIGLIMIPICMINFAYESTSGLSFFSSLFEQPSNFLLAGVISGTIGAFGLVAFIVYILYLFMVLSVIISIIISITKRGPERND